MSLRPRNRIQTSAQLPLSLLRAAKDNPMLVELKNGETYNGTLTMCDFWMNVSLKDVICTSRDGDRFWKLPECHIRGNNIKYLRIPDEVIDMVTEEPKTLKRDERMAGRGGRGRGRGGMVGGRDGGGRGRGGRGRGDGGGRGEGGRGGRGGRGRG